MGRITKSIRNRKIYWDLPPYGQMTSQMHEVFLKKCLGKQLQCTAKPVTVPPGWQKK